MSDYQGCLKCSIYCMALGELCSGLSKDERIKNEEKLWEFQERVCEANESEEEL